jgi:hypothetical protein
VILLLLACAGSGGDDSGAAETFLPEPGAWFFSWSDTLTGTCQLDDMESRQPTEPEEWGLELEANGFTFYDQYGYPVGCDLDDHDFSCSEGGYGVKYKGYDATEWITSGIEGTFDDETHVTGGYWIGADCYGDDCAEIGPEMYGSAFTYPCEAIAEFTGELGE